MNFLNGTIINVHSNASTFLQSVHRSVDELSPELCCFRVELFHFPISSTDDDVAEEDAEALAVAAACRTASLI